MKNTRRKKQIYISVLSVFLLVMNLFSSSGVLAESDKTTYESAEDVLKYINNEKPRISSDGKSIVLPESPDPNYEVSLYGSDNKQIIDMDLNYYQPISNMNINILYKVTNKNDSSDYATSSEDIPVRAKGKYQHEQGDNDVPNVVPGLREWKGYTGSYKLSESTRLIVDSPDLKETASLIQSYFKNMIDKDVAIVEGSDANSGDILLTQNKSQQHLGKEGYTLDITDKIVISAPTSKGILYGGTSITQILSQSEKKNEIPKGMARDYPKYEVRSGMLDVGRMYIPLEYVQEMTEYMAWFKMSEMQMHINDYRGGANYSGFRVESKKYPEINAEDGYYTQEEYIAYQKDMQKYGIDVVTEIDTPYHAESFRAVNPDMMLKKGYLDITTPEKRELVYPFVESLFDEFLGDGPDDKNRVVQSNKFHIGTDEYDKQYSEEMRAYTDHFIKYVNKKGYESRLWGSIGKNGFDGETPVSNEATMNIWAGYWSDVNEMYGLGYDIINTCGGDLYIVPLGNAGYPDRLDIKDKYDSWEVNDFWCANRQGGKGGATMPYAHPQTKGAEFALWNDMTAYTGGLSSYDIFDRYKDAVMLVAEKTWYGEKTEGQTSGQFMERVEAVQDKIPMSNPGKYIESKTEMVLNYDFESVDKDTVKDLSGNGYDAQIKGGNIADGLEGHALELDGSNYLELPVSSIGYPYSISFDLKLDKGSLKDASLFTGKDGSLYVNMDQTGELGFERNEQTSAGSKHKFENYKFSFENKLKENEWQHVILVGDKNETTLFVDGRKVSTAKQINKLEGHTNDSSTFVLPLEKIGKGIKGKLDNIKLMNKNLENSLQKNLAADQKVTASTTYDNTQSADHVVDGNFGTRWGSQYKNMTEAEKDNQWIMVELDDSYDLDTVKIYWEKARAEEYKLLTSNDGENFEEVYHYDPKSQTSQTDTIDLKDVHAKFVKVEMSKRSTTYGYSMFELEVYGQADIKHGEKLVNQAEDLLDIIPLNVSGENERKELIAAKDELKDYLSNEELDIFTYDILAGKLIDKLKDFKETVTGSENLAYQQKATASTKYNESQGAHFMIDGDTSTRWSSNYKNMTDAEKDDQWVELELDKAVDVDTVLINWEKARAAKYKILVSNNGVDYEEVYTYDNDDRKELVDLIDLGDLNAKFIKIAMSQRATNYGYSIYELEVYNFSEAKKLIKEADQLLTRTPEESSGEKERADLIAAKNELETYFISGDKNAVTYYTLTATLTNKLTSFKETITQSANLMINTVERFKNDGEFANDRAAHDLTIHLTAVGQYEKKGSADKVVKHMEGFKRLLDHQLQDRLISEKAYNSLKKDADTLIKQWD